MVLAAPKARSPRLSARRLMRQPSRYALLPGVVSASQRGEMRAGEEQTLKRAQLMAACRCAIYVSESVPEGRFVIIDPAYLEAGERGLCPFTVRTLTLHPNDIDQAIAHFKAQT